MNTRSTRLVLTLSAAALAAAACGRKSETVTMSADSGKIAVAASDSGMALPADFPKDVPVMKGAVVKAVMGSPAQGNLMVFMASPAPVAEVSAFYEQELKAQGWSTESRTGTSEGGISTHKKAGRDLMLTLAKDAKGTNIQIALPQRKG